MVFSVLSVAIENLKILDTLVRDFAVEKQTAINANEVGE